MCGVAAGALVGAVTFAGCGGSNVSSDAQAPVAADFPTPDGRTLAGLLADIEPTEEIVVSPAAQVVDKGTSRFPFGVFTVGREPIVDAEVALYAAHGSDDDANGPFVGRPESLKTEPAFSSETTAQDPDAPEIFYVSELELDRKGEWQILAVVKQDGELRTTRVPSLVAGKFDAVPSNGDEAIVVNTPTADDVGGDLAKIDTRTPPDTMHAEDFADVVGRKPAVLLFATPALCQSRVCGPVVDIAEQVKEETDADVSFIHMEIYVDNQFDKGLRPQVQAYNLPTEPWVFVFDDQGSVSTAMEGAFSVEELRDAVATVTN